MTDQHALEAEQKLAKLKADKALAAAASANRALLAAESSQRSPLQDQATETDDKPED